MDSENDKKEEERKIISRCFYLSFSRGHRRGSSTRQDDAEEKFLPSSFCPLAGFIHAASENDREKTRRREIRTHLDLAVGGSSRG